MARFFIHRPVFAWVLAIIVMLAGWFGLSSLPISQYPQIAPTTVRISANYSGATSTTVANSVTSVIEDGLTGLDGLTYMTSTSSSGSSSISLVFDETVDPDMAQVQVQNKLQLVQSSLPEAVTSTGVSVTRSTSSILLVGALVSEDGSYDQTELGDILDRTIKDPVQRTDGVGSINSFSAPYAMRIWLDPDKLYKYGLTANDVTDAVSDQNSNVTVGSLGDLPAATGQQITVPLNAQSQLASVPEFEQIALTTAEDGSTVYLGDVSRIEINSEDLGSSSRFDGHPAAGFGVNLATGANAVETAAAVRATIDKLASALPEGVTVAYPYDTSPFVEESINQVYHTLGEAIVLVFLVILIFLQSWRATLIPTIAVPIVLLGTFGVLAVFGMSINTLTMFALVLAIGLLVDDAIVVVENVERIMEEEKLGPVEATEKSMDEISGALVGIVLVLSAVFLPMAFMSGSTGIIYRQFSVTIISAMVLSLFVALILTPAMCASLLKPSHGEARFAPARWFNRGVGGVTSGYTGAVNRLVRRPFRMFIVLIAVGFGAGYVYTSLPSSFVPTEDQGVLMAMVQLPDNATRVQTEQAVEQVEDYMLNNQSDNVDAVFAAVGFSFGGSGQNNAMMFIRLKDFEEREGMGAGDIAMAANMHFGGNSMGQIIFMQPPAIQGMGSSSGFDMYLVDDGGNGTEALHEAADTLVAKAQETGILTGLRGNDAASKTSMQLDIDRQKAQAFGLTISQVNAMLSTIFAGSYVNDFTLNDKLREVIVQGDTEFRMQPDDITKWFARNSDDEMVPFGAFIDQSWDQTAASLGRYGGTNAIEITGDVVTGVSSGDGMAKMEELVADLPGTYSAAWVGLSLQEQVSGNQEPMLYSLSALVVFLCLAALYESWTVPFAVMLSVPVGILGALIAAQIFGQSNDVYFKVGMLTTIGLAARNAILIVEFAEGLRKDGQSLLEATLVAAKQRLRPIMMTTLAFMLGILPLAIATGAGANAQNSIGIGMLGGITFSALFGIVMVPVFYVAVMLLVGKFKRKETAQ
ncbi:multidrug efflux RND transporter permease subunit [Salipiger sp. CCB-MM3]|uniref:efflux RND transporter permease subunit n=1 Tax=Salipiger sp. CCB-MM3 TaxID=1792508 RepID=UPI00080AB22C|nr:efflux RND transporter permease subunit [Salipiger sp. CCB-MM3]ANT62731.1 multidrug efflux RND transporter permease subunit [Salipiger sp. CCB-MM3]